MLLGSMNSESIMSLEGSIAWPIQDQYGFQLDAIYSNLGQNAQSDDSHLGGLGAHYFWRDSETALIGLQTGYVMGSPADSWEFGIEAERYFESFTLGGKAGIATVQFDSSAAPFERDKDAFYFQFYLGFYPINDLLISPTIEHRFDNTMYGVEIEYELPVAGLSVFANAMQGDNDYQHAYLGVRYYFDKDKSLKSRHRESDPKIQLHSMQYGIAAYQAESRRQHENSQNQNGGGGSIGGSGTIGGNQSGGSLVIGPGNSPSSLTNVFTGTTTVTNGTLSLTGSTGIASLIGVTPVTVGSGTFTIQTGTLRNLSPANILIAPQ